MLIVKNICKSYKNKQVLCGVDLTVKTGEIKGLIGVNGAGKSTLIEIICGVKKFDDGYIEINGIDITNKKRKLDIQKTIGYMPQSFSLFNDLTVEENLGYLCAVYDINLKRVDEVINICHLNEFKKVLAKNLSGGYRQLLSMAGAIIHSPKFLILDEPTNAMDPIFRKRFWQIVNSLKKDGITVLVITHYWEELVECDNFACLAGGKIKFNGSLSEFKQDGLLDIEQILNKYTLEE